MIGILKDKEIEDLLHTQVLGRIGCSSGERMFVVPINYGYDGKCLYAHSKEGMKIDMMRANNNVCFEVDKLEADGSWSSVIVWGVYEEIRNIRSQRAAMKIFTEQMARLIPDPKAMPSHGFVSGAEKTTNPFKSVVFKIRITEKTGRFENK